MSAITPGDKFEVSYGNGHKLQVVALSLRQKREVTGMLTKIQTLQEDPTSIGLLFELCEDMLRICCPDLPDHLLDEIDEKMAMEVVSNTIGLASVSEEDAKKSGSPH